MNNIKMLTLFSLLLTSLSASTILADLYTVSLENNLRPGFTVHIEVGVWAWSSISKYIKAGYETGPFGLGGLGGYGTPTRFIVSTCTDPAIDIVVDGINHKYAGKVFNWRLRVEENSQGKMVLKDIGLGKTLGTSEKTLPKKPVVMDKCA